MSAKKNKSTTKKTASAKAVCKKSVQVISKKDVKKYLPEAKGISIHRVCKLRAKVVGQKKDTPPRKK